MLETDDTTPRKRKKAHRFDRVIKENLEGLFDPLAAKLFGIDRAETEALRAVLKDKLHVTLEREADYLKRFTYPDNPNQDHIFHLEIQSTPGRAMLHRMLLYYAMLLTIYRVPVRQCILYIGNDSVQVLRRILRHPNLRFRFEVFDIRDYAADLFLDSSNPAEIILAILANFGNATATEIVARIVERLRT